ncbi:hypothetical protein D3868_07725 [Azospirillum brasilense]|uniref:Uncharacterized protein n=1 Tax=Azospirillum brasilense TaxID=192 RepID=A0A4D8QI31_AZOBR|nr:hypothetical protein FE89_28945 [Azospirillum brasilense]QCO08931.1 hypothetical protein D3868_07725 [Azospirillum brasilense]
MSGLLVWLLTTTGSHAASSRYTPIGTADCHTVADPLAMAYASRDLGVRECPAVPGVRLFLVSSDANSWFDILHDGLHWSAEQAVAYNQPFGHFPNVGGADAVEWRFGADGAVTALIFRIVAQVPDEPDRLRSRLVAVRLGASGICLLGTATSNDAARAMADTSRGCDAQP